LKQKRGLVQANSSERLAASGKQNYCSKFTEASLQKSNNAISRVDCDVPAQAMLANPSLLPTQGLLG